MGTLFTNPARKASIVVVAGLLSLVIGTSGCVGYLDEITQSQPDLAPISFTTIQHDIDFGGKIGIGCSSSTTCHATGAVQMTTYVPMATTSADLMANHTAWVGQVNSMDPANSMIIQKPLGNLAHGGGQVIEKGEPLYNRWITYIMQGAPQ